MKTFTLAASPCAATVLATGAAARRRVASSAGVAPGPVTVDLFPGALDD